MADAEIPYDGVDQDGDGADLVDVDGDGYASQLAVGPDCNDRDPASHPGAVDQRRDGIDVDCDGWDAPPGASQEVGEALGLYLVVAGAVSLRWALNAAAAIPLLLFPIRGRPSSRSGTTRGPALRSG